MITNYHTMKRTMQISIPKPCHEDWNKMTPVEKGKHCAVCNKNVIDFTNYSNEQLIKHLEKEKNLCGRFKKTQLNKNISLERKDKNSFASYVASTLFAFLSFGNFSAKAQEKPKTEQMNKQFVSLGISNKKTKEEKEIIKLTGVIVDQSGPLPGASILIKGTTTETTTDFDGNFSLECKIGDTLMVSYIGFISQEIITKENNPKITLELEEDFQGDIIVVGGAFSANKPKRLFYKNSFLYRRWYK